jgi:hypothetical protein
MRAWRSDSRARTALSLCTPRRLFLLALLAFWVTAGFVAVRGVLAAPTRTSSRPPADTTRDESGFKVRVVEDSKGKRSSSGGLPATPTPPDVPEATPEPPDVPEPPEVDHSDANDLVRFGEDITIAADKVVDGDVVAIGGDVTVLGRVKGDVVAVGGAVEVKGAGVVEGDAVSLGGGVSTADSASVAGSNVSIGTMRFWRGQGMLPMLGLAGAVGFGAWLISTIGKVGLTIFFAWIVLLLWKDGLLRAEQKLREQFGKSFLWGMITMAGLVVAIPVGIVSLILVGAIAIVILCITLIGIPVALLLVIALVVAIVALIVGVIFAIFMGYLNGVLYLGRRILGTRAESMSPLVAILVGLAVIMALGIAAHLVGLLGLLVFHPLSIAFGIAARALCFILTLAGLGALWLSFVQGGGFSSIRSYNWGRRSGAHVNVTVGGTPERRAPESNEPPAPPPSGGTADAP